jgi:hypothetical protein
MVAISITTYLFGTPLESGTDPGRGDVFFRGRFSGVQMSNVEPNVQTDFKFFSWFASNFQENVKIIEKNSKFGGQ